MVVLGLGRVGYCLGIDAVGPCCGCRAERGQCCVVQRFCWGEVGAWGVVGGVCWCCGVLLDFYGEVVVEGVRGCEIGCV